MNSARRLAVRALLGTGLGPLAPEAVRSAVTGRLVVVTGGSRGIGARTATRLAACGARLVLLARTRADLVATRDRLRHGGAEVHVVACDLRDTDAATRAAREVLRRSGIPDAVICGAGHSIRRPLADSIDRPHDVTRTAGSNYAGPVAFLLPLIEAMSRRGRGHVVALSSTAIDLPLPNWSAYTASKAAFETWLDCVAPELATHHVACSSIHLPRVATAMSAPTSGRYPVPELTVDEAAALVCRALVVRPRIMRPWWACATATVHAAAPGALDRAWATLLTHGLCP